MWNADLVKQLFNPHEAQSILQIPISQAGLRDRLVWQHTQHGNFSVASAYHWLSQQHLQAHHASSSRSPKSAAQRMWTRLWKLKIKGKIKHFVWRAFHRILPTLDTLSRKGIVADATCQICGEAEESIEHLFFHCSAARIIWQLAPVSWPGLDALTHDFQRWWTELCCIGSKAIDHCRLELTTYLLWNIWKMRNELCHNAHRLPVEEVVRRSHHEWLEYSTLLSRTISTKTVLKPHAVHTLSSMLMNEAVGYHLIATSSLLKKHSQTTSYGLFATDHRGAFLQAQATFCNPCSDAIQTALESIRAAQLLAYQNGWQHIIIQNDVEEIFPIVQQKHSCPAGLSTISEDIILLKHLFETCTFVFIPKHENKISLSLAKYAIEHSISENWSSSWPSWLL